MFKKQILFLLGLLFLSSCVREDLSDCAKGGFRLHFRYTYNSQGQNLLASKVQDARVYIFDQRTGLLVDVIRVGGADLRRGYVDVDIPEGIYTASAWGGSGEDMMSGGYKDSQFTDATNHIYLSPAQVGSATLENFRMMLTYNLLPDAIPGEVAPKIPAFDDLFFAVARDIVVGADGQRSVDFDFVKNTATLKVKLSGVDYLTNIPPSPVRGMERSEQSLPFDIFVLGKNARYRFDNRIGEYARILRCDPVWVRNAPNVIEIDIKLQRLSIDRHTDLTTPTADPVELFVQDPVSGRNLIPPLDVVRTILQAKDEAGQYIYQSQEDLDRADEYPIEIVVLHNLSVKIAVNGYEIEDLDPDITRP